MIISISPNHGPKNGSPTGLKICDCLYTSLSLGSYFFISLLWYIPLAVGCICLGIKWVVDGRKISWFQISSFFPQAKIVYQFSSDMKACFLFFTLLVLNPSHIICDGLSEWLFSGRLIRCKKTEQTFNEDSGSCVLTPTSGNHHTIHNTR